MYLLVKLLSWPHWSCFFSTIWLFHNTLLVLQYQNQTPQVKKQLPHSPLRPWTTTLTFMPLPCPRKTQLLVLVRPPPKVVFHVNTSSISPASFLFPRVSTTLGPILQLAHSSHVLTHGVNLDSEPINLDDYGSS